MRNFILAAAAAAVVVPTAIVVPTDSAQAQRRYSNGAYNGPVWRDRQGRYRCRRGNGTTGLIVGAAGGALVGQAIGRDTKSTVIGAAGGALLGAVIGQATTPQRRGQQLCRYQERNGNIYTAPCDDRYYNGDY